MATRKPASAERRAKNAEAARRYRARLISERAGVDVPEPLQRQRPAQYHPPRITRETPKREANRARTDARNQSRETAAKRASAKVQAERQARVNVIRTLPQGRNPEAEIFKANPLKRKVAQNADAVTIRRRGAAEKLQSAGRGLKRDFKAKPGTVYGEAEKRLSRAEFTQFRDYLARLAGLSNQTLAIYFHHEGGSGLLDSIITGILYPPDGGSPSDALGRMERLVLEAEQGEENYGEEAVGKLDV